ncbi:MAG: response regulator [Proteobacteria bacterium]|nr:response regulator [Pseudomonadota bacterium]
MLDTSGTETQLSPREGMPVVLLVDDDEEVLATFGHVLDRMGARVLKSKDVVQATQRLCQQHVDVLICDQSLPGVSGLKLLETVREQWPHVVRALMTGKPDTEVLAGSINRARVHRVLVKPLPGMELRGLLDDLVQEARRRSLGEPLREANLLVVDDDPAVGRALRRDLRSHNVHVHVAEGVDEGLRLLESNKIDLILADLVMPGKDGISLLEVALRRWPEAKRVLMTGHGDANDMLEALNRGGVQRFVRKSKDLARMRPVVQEMLGLHYPPRTSQTRNESPAIKGRVLVVEDEDLLLQAYARHLEAAGCEVVACRGSSEALAVFSRSRVDAVITDITMPGMDGLALLRALRELDDSVKVVLVTGVPSAETAIEALDKGAFKYLVKPVDTMELARIAERAIQVTRMARMQREAMQIVSSDPLAYGARGELEAAFDRALARLVIHYQPIVKWSQREIFGFEALVRSGEPSMAHSGALFSAAERLGRLQELGKLIRRSVAKPMLNRPEKLFVNLHPAELGDPLLLDAGSDLVAIAERVVFEITERAGLSEVTDVRERIAAIRACGASVAVDDLGAGYAGLSNFALLEPEVAKLDQGLVHCVHRIPTKQKLIRSMAELCRDMGVHLIAEGVETREECDVLAAIGCDLFQGYLFARPGNPLPAVTWG